MTKTKCDCGCSSCESPPLTFTPADNRNILIEWQRLVHEDKTCPRCGDTGAELDKASVLLTQVFAPLGVVVEMRKTELTLAEFKQNPPSSNQILINGKSLESLVGATSGASACCDVCGDDVDCRTVELAGQTFATVPARLIVLACLEAYIQMEKQTL